MKFILLLVKNGIRQWDPPKVHDYLDVFIPPRAILLFRGDVFHSGLGFMRENRRGFRYVGVRGFTHGVKPYVNKVLRDPEFTKECHRGIGAKPIKL